MKIILLFIAIFLTSHIAIAQATPLLVFDNLVLSHEHKGWRVVSKKEPGFNFNLVKDDLIIRIDGKNAAETGPMQMANLFNQDNRRKVTLFIERANSRTWIALRELKGTDYSPVGAVPFENVARGFSEPDVKFDTFDNKTVTLEQYKGKWLVINFFATWCPPCMDELPAFIHLAENESERLNLITVALKDRPNAVRDIIHQYNMISPVAMMNPFAQLPVQLGITTNRASGQLPAWVLIKPDGEVAMIYQSSMDAENIEKKVVALMNSNSTEE